MLDSPENAPKSRIWTTVASFAIQMAGVGVLVLLPFLFTQALPSVRISEAPAPPHAPRMHQQVTKLERVPEALKGVQRFADDRLVAPSRIPQTTSMTPDPVAPTFSDIDSVGVPYGDLNDVSTGRRHNVVDDLLAAAAPPARPRLTPTRPPVRPSVLLEGNLVKRVEPVYPRVAILGRIQGQVLLWAIIDSDGRIANLKATSGNPLLIGAAIDAVRQWRYRPYVLNGAPIEVETQITVNFTLK